MDWAAQNGKDSTGIMTVARKNKKVAIVGSGPAGLSAGYKLNLLGYDTTIFESQPVAGGMLVLGIPEHRLPKDILNVDIQYILKSGVKLITNKTLGKDFSIDGLFKEGYEAVFLATGAYKSLRLKIADEDAEGVIPGMKLLTQTNLKKDVVLGKKVGIIGGGNAAIDAARVAIRNRNTTKVTILYRRTRKEMPAYEEEIESSIEEGIEIHFLVAPIKVLTDNGRVKGIECIKMELGKMDESGRRRPVPIEGSEFIVELDTLIPAIGERPDIAYIEEKDKLRTTKWDTIVVNEVFFSTEHEVVYAGGDVVTGPNTVIKAIAAGKTAAESIDKYLQGKSLEKEYKLSRPSQFIKPVELTEEEVECAHRLEMPQLSVKDRHKNFMEVATGFTQEMAVKEARRCLRCELETEDGKKAMGQE
jgi:NADH-quinone oxidoreductase subunit F